VAATGSLCLERNCGGRRRSGDRSLVASRCDAELPDEGARHVALVGEAHLKRGLSWRATCGQEPPGKTHSALEEIGVRRCPHVAGKAAQKLEAA